MLLGLLAFGVELRLLQLGRQPLDLVLVALDVALVVEQIAIKLDVAIV